MSDADCGSFDKSAAIQEAVRLTTADGNEVVETSEGWTEIKQVVHMRESLTVSTRRALEGDRRLRYWRAEPTPHNKAEEGFTDDFNKVSIAFPR
jgi:hypothetical protein